VKAKNFSADYSTPAGNDISIIINNIIDDFWFFDQLLV